MGRHRHAVNVRTDGLAAVLGPLARDPRVRAAALVDVDSGMVLDACGPDAAESGPETESRGAAHAELVRTVTALAAGPESCELVVHAADGSRHVLQQVVDPHGGRLALAVVVVGSSWVLSRLRRRLRAVSGAALTAGPSMALRPTADGWEPNRLLPPAPPAPAAPGAPSTGEPARPDRDLLWLPAASGPETDGPTVPALTGLPVPASEPLPRRRPGSAWTAPPAPSTAVDVNRAEPEEEPAAAADLVPGQRRPAPPSALPPGASWPVVSPVPSAAPAEDGAGTPPREPA